ncbi:hypoxanthine phosphoribosyltransferase [Anopheles sinensis]|uniref:Hypoxanthine phosphoribosyltransferase n=1 Tax=Anopheles sinensis TaxID=74873 RepID=A0A084WBN1_ANOSI|nr:hypoxanthine phosphoribosyltransferase [Anopheles sinensis]
MAWIFHAQLYEWVRKPNRTVAIRLEAISRHNKTQWDPSFISLMRSGADKRPQDTDVIVDQVSLVAQTATKDRFAR